MEIHKLPYHTTRQFSQLILDYYSNNPDLQPFYTYRPEITAFAEAISHKAKHFDQEKRDVLVEVLNEQHQFVKLSEATKKNIDSLGESNTFTVTTGHQLCLFTGPLYFIYKIFSTINLAEALQKHYGNYNFVPVFWMASEDHDFEEIASAHIFGKTLEWQTKAGGAVGNLNTGSLKGVLEELNIIAGDSEHAAYIKELFHKAYLEHENLAGATRYLVNELFGQYGLVIIDGNDKALKREFAPVMKAEVLSNPTYEAVQKQAELLSKNYQVQAHPREINLFYMDKQVRELIIEEGDHFKVRNTDIAFSTDEILAAIDNEPQKFSPNVLLRPLYQETILPNLAYIGGGAEVAYWLELKTSFEHYDVPFPVVMLRNSALWINASDAARIQKLGLKPVAIFEDEDYLIKQHIMDMLGDGEPLKKEITQVNELFENIVKLANSIDASLKSAVLAEGRKAEKSVENIQKKIIRAEKRKRETTVNQIKRLKKRLFPNGVLQERYENFVPFWLQYGPDFFEVLKKHLDPLDFKFTVVVDDEQ